MSNRRPIGVDLFAGEVAPPNGARAMLMKRAGREGAFTPKIDPEKETKKEDT